MTSTFDIIWLAGFLEGEGSFLRDKKGCVTIKAESTDEDVIHRAARIMDAPVYHSTYNSAQNPKWNSTLRFSVHGNRAAGWMMTLYNQLGQRRRSRISKVLGEWRKAETKSRQPRRQAHYGGGR